MRFYHVLAILLIGMILGSVLVIFFGNEGYVTYLLQKEHREILINNIEDLKMKNAQLQQKINLLKSNPEVIRVLARKLGYYGREENIIVLKGDLTFNNRYEIGNIVKKMKSRPDINLVLRIIGFSASIFFIVLLVLLKQRSKKRHKKRKVHDHTT